MTREKQLVLLDVASDLIAKIHADLCRTTKREDGIADDTMEILRLMFVLGRKLKGGAEE